MSKLNLIKLRIKAKTLAEEARIIRVEESKQRGDSRADLREHRRFTVSTEARATHLAISYIKGKPYIEVEPKRRLEKEWAFRARVLPKVTAMVKKYCFEKFSEEEIKNYLGIPL